MKTFCKWLEDVPSTSTASVAMPPTMRKKKKVFDVPTHIFKRFQNNERVKYERWVKYLGTGMYEDSVLKYIKDNKQTEIILRDNVSGQTKTIKSV
jgi:hypothetical protein